MIIKCPQSVSHRAGSKLLYPIVERFKFYPALRCKEELPYPFYTVGAVDIQLWEQVRQQIPDSIEDAKAEYQVIIQQRLFDKGLI